VIEEFDHRSFATNTSMWPSRSKSAIAMPRPLPGLDNRSCETPRKSGRCRHCGRQGEPRFEKIGVTIGAEASFVLTAPDVVEIPLEVARNDQVEQTSLSRSTQAALVDQPLPATPARRLHR